jgi:hypothetical protein
MSIARGFLENFRQFGPIWRKCMKMHVYRSMWYRQKYSLSLFSYVQLIENGKIYSYGYIPRYNLGEWKSTTWRKIYAGDANSAKNIATTAVLSLFRFYLSQGLRQLLQRQLPSHRRRSRKLHQQGCRRITAHAAKVDLSACGTRGGEAPA